MEIDNLNCIDIQLDSFKHHGVPGMKWGVRKARPSKGPRQRRSKKTVSKDSVIKRPKTKRGMNKLSNAELQKSISRMQLETNYKRLNTNKEGVNKLVSEVMRELTKDAIKTGVKTGIKATSNYIKTPDDKKKK